MAESFDVFITLKNHFSIKTIMAAPPPQHTWTAIEYNYRSPGVKDQFL